MNTPARLVDRFGRSIRYLRLSVTDRCDFRCVYCMADDMTFLPRDQVLSLEEMLELARAFVAVGVDSIRLTGGEPLIRRNIAWLVEQLAALEGLSDLSLTTNGAHLAAHADALRRAGLKRVNISIDSLDATRFRALTRTGDLSKVLAGIDAACAAGFERIRLNAVILRGHNDQDVLPLVTFARERGVNIAFIEEMPLGVIDDHDRALAHMSSADIRALIETRYPLVPDAFVATGPARYFSMADSSTRIGFISPHSHNFCADCNRVRLTAEGRLLLCLGNEHSLDLRAILRDDAIDEAERPARLQQALEMAMTLKPERHHFDLHSAPGIVRFMNMTGG